MFSYSVGERPLPSVAPPTKQKFSKVQNRRGGGLVLECQYFLQVAPDVDSEMVMREVKDVLAKMQGNETITVSATTTEQPEQQQHQAEQKPDEQQEQQRQSQEQPQGWFFARTSSPVRGQEIILAPDTQQDDEEEEQGSDGLVEVNEETNLWVGEIDGGDEYVDLDATIVDDSTRHCWTCRCAKRIRTVGTSTL